MNTLLGPNGVGKSTLGNQLLGTFAFALDNNQMANSQYISVATGNFLGSGPCITVIDTPGTKDGKGMA